MSASRSSDSDMGIGYLCQYNIAGPWVKPSSFFKFTNLWIMALIFILVTVVLLHGVRRLLLTTSPSIFPSRQIEKIWSVVPAPMFMQFIQVQQQPFITSQQDYLIDCNVSQEKVYKLRWSGFIASDILSSALLITFNNNLMDSAVLGFQRTPILFDILP